MGVTDLRLPGFRKLPPEVRHMIWILLLDAPAVWHTAHPHVNLQAHGPVLRMQPVGAAPFQVGLVNRETRALMEAMYTKHLASGGVGGKGTYTISPEAAYWLIPELTIICMGCPSRATDFLDIFRAHERLPLLHVVLHWSDIVDVIRVSLSLATKCPNLATFIMHGAEIQGINRPCGCESDPSQAMADAYAYIADWEEVDDMPYEEHPDVDWLDWTVSEYFDTPQTKVFPRLHFLPPEIKWVVPE